jgi:hypothetical protein
MKFRGKHTMKPITLMNGFYIEIRNVGSKERPIKLRSESKEAMESNARQYKSYRKEVTILGEHKDEVWV